MKKLSLLSLMTSISLLYACEDADAPEEFNDEETINRVGLIFSPLSGGSPISVNAFDEDGDGPGDLVLSDSIRLKANTEYELFVSFENTLTNEDITEEVEEEGAEHMIFFAFTNDIFSSPTGNGNIDLRSDPLNYSDMDVNGQPIGLNTEWVTGEPAKGSFELVLKHQPDVKTADSGSGIGETDIAITWGMVITD